MVPIEVFVFMDFACVKGNYKDPTEVSLLAVPRSQYKDPENTNEPQDKITINIKEMTYEEALKQFDEFIRKFQKPVCLVAHNGIRFDFQVLKRMLKICNVSLPNDLLCADSIYAFYDILKDKYKITDRGDKLLLEFDTNPLNNNFSKSNKQAMTKKDNTNDKDIKGYEDNNKESISHVVPEEQGTSGVSKIKSSIQTNDIAFDTQTDAKPETSDQIANDKEVTDAQCYKSNEDLEDNIQMQLKNENTPKKRTLEATSEPIDHKRQKLDSKSVNLPDPGNTKRNLWKDDELDEEFTIKYKGRAIRKHFHDGHVKPKYGLYTLEAIYKLVVKYPPIKPHPVENDVYMKFRISHKLGKRFLAWTNQIQLKFTDVPEKEVSLHRL